MEDLIKRRQLLKERLEGKSSENEPPSSSLKQTRVKSNPTRLHIPTIFQLNKSTENLTVPSKLSSQNNNISKSTGNIYKDSSLKLASFEDNSTKVSAKPPRKLSSSFCMKLDDAKSNEDLSASQNETKLKFSRSFSVTKFSENNATDEDEKKRKVSRSNFPENKFFTLADDEEMKKSGEVITNPVIVSIIRKKSNEEADKIPVDNEDATVSNEETSTEEGLVMLRNKLSHLRASKIKKNSVDALPTMSFNFLGKPESPSASPQSPILQKLEKNPNLKRSGSRVGFIVREEMMKQNEENNNDDANSLYDNLQLKHTSIKNDSHEKLNNNCDIVDSLYDNLKLKNTPLDKMEDKCIENDYTNRETCEAKDDLLLQKEPNDESKEEAELNNSLYGRFDDMEYNKEEINKKLEKKYNHMIHEVLYENIEVVRANNYYSKKFLLGPVYKKPIPTKRNMLSN